MGSGLVPPTGCPRGMLGPMKRGERIRLIQEAAEIFLTRRWSDAQLTLDQFGFATYEPRENDWDFDPQSYFIDQIKNGEDAVLAELHEYLRGDDAAPERRTGDLPWGTEPLRIFVSHTHEHRSSIG